MEAEKIEEKSELSLLVSYVSVPGSLCLALMADAPALSVEILAENRLSAREIAEGRCKNSPGAYRAWLLGRLAAKAAAAKKWGLTADRAEITRGPEGRPLLNGQSGPWVSISHTVGAAAALAADFPVGLDLEKKDRNLGPRTEAWAFSPEELNLAALSGPSPFPGALSLWCAREAGAKSWGLGLLNHLDRVRVTAADWPSGRLTVSWLGEESRRAEVRLIIHGGYLLALAL